MTQFLIIVKGGKGLSLNKFNAEDRRVFLAKWKEWLKTLKKRRWLINGSPLAVEGTALYSTGSMIEVPENYDMATEIITGFCVITATDQADAISILQSCPFLEDEFTNCELREFKNMP